MAKIILRAGKVAIKIILPLVILGLIFYSVKVLVPAQAEVGSFPDELSAQFDQAETYQEQGRYAEAEQIYQSIIERYPLTDYHFEAQRQLTILYINWDKPAEAEAALQEFVRIYSNYAGVAEAVCEVFDRYREFNPGKAIEIFQYALDTWPESDHAMWAQAGLVQSYLVLEDKAGAQAAIEKLLTGYSEDENIADIVIYIANEYWHSNPQVLELYEYAISTWPDNKDAIWAQAGLIRANIVLGNDLNVPEAVDELLEQFSESEFIVEAVLSIAGGYYDVRKYENARQLYEYAISTWPDNKDAVWAGAGIIRANIDLGNDLNVPEVVDELRKQFYGSEFIAEAVFSIAGNYYDVGKYENALDLHQYTLNTFPDCRDEDVTRARARIIRANIALGDDTNTQEGLDELIAEFADSPGLPELILQIGGAYSMQARWRAMDGDTESEKASYQYAISVWERLLQEFPDSEAVSHAYYFSARCYERLGKYDNAIEHFETVLRDWPGYQYAWNVQFLLGRCYGRLKEAGVISKVKVEAYTEIRVVYEQLLQDYPNCPAARAAQDWLDHNN